MTSPLQNRAEALQSRAEALFKRREAQVLDGRSAAAEYEQQGRAVREKTARLRALRLARESADQKPKPAKPPPRRRRASGVET